MTGPPAARRAPSTIEWAAIVVIVLAGVALAVPERASPRAPDMREAMVVEMLPGGRAVTRLADDTWHAVCAAAGIPGPASLDGTDPVPVGLLLDEVERWTTHGDVAALGRLGRIYQALEEHRAALECFAAVAALAPDDAIWRYLVGVEAQTLGRADLAVSMLEASRTAEPDYAVADARLGRLYLERGDLERAEASYARYAEAHAGRSLGHVGLARVALARGEATRAESLLERAIGATPNDFLAHRFLSRALAAQGRAGEARAASERAERLPKYSGWLMFDERLEASHALARTQRWLENRMRLAQGTGDQAELVRLARALLERRPDDDRTLGILATAQLRLGRTDAARTTVDRAIELRPESPAVLCLAAQVDLAAGDPAAARRALEAAQAIDPRYAPAFDLEARLLFAQGRTAEAIWCMRQSLALAPERTGARLVLATMLERTRRFEAAARALRAVLDREPEHAEARRRLAALEARGVRVTPRGAR